jgi:hypothetical protein
MKMIIKILVVIVAIVSVAAVVAMFTRNKYTLKRDVIVKKPKDEVFHFIKLNRNQTHYSKWLSFDPETRIDFFGAEDGQPGAILAFASKDKRTGKGEWETRRIVEGERVEFELRFLEPFQFTANGHFSTEAVSPTETKVTWVYNSGMDWPMNFMLLFLDMEKVVGNDIQTSLSTLKVRLEKP